MGSIGIYVEAMASSLVTFHVAANAKGLATPGMRASEGLFSCMRVAVNSQTAGTAESFAAGRANIPVLALRIRHAVHGTQIVMMLPRTC